MFNTTNNDISILQERLTKINKDLVKTAGNKWSFKVANKMKENYINQLETQGRSDSSTRPLSSATMKIYEHSGSPNGEGIRNHVSIASKILTNKVVYGMVIEKGKPSMIATVQNDGAVIGVTDKMRGYLATQGIFLKKDTLAIVIPGRESFSKALEKTKPYAKQVLKEELKQWWSKNR